MAVDLVGALVGWLVSRVGDTGFRVMQSEWALRKALRLAIDKVVEQAGGPSSRRDALGRELRECFSAPPRLRLDASTSVSEGLRAAIAAQLAQLDRMVHRKTGQPFYEAVKVDREWLIDQVTTAMLAALRQLAAKDGLAGLVHAIDAENARGASDTAGWRGPVWAVPPLRGDEVARPGLMEDLVAAVTRPRTSAVGMITGLWGAGGGSGRRRWLGCWCTAMRFGSSSPTDWCG